MTKKSTETPKKKATDGAAAKTASKSSGVSFQPTGARLFVLPSEGEEVSPGGIYLPEAAREKPKRGRVEAIGKDVTLVKVGEEVLYERYAGNKLVLDDVEYLVLKDEELMGVYE